MTSDEDGRVWLMLHSGSRNVGKEIAERHIYKAKGLEHNLGLPDRDLALFLAGTKEMDAYLSDLYWAQEYAARNRAVMRRRRFRPTSSRGRSPCWTSRSNLSEAPVQLQPLVLPQPSQT